MGWFERFAAEVLRDLRARGLERRERVVEQVDGPFLVIEGRRILSFASNDYLGIGREPAVAAAARRAAERWGWGTSSARLLAGTTEEHVALEQEIGRVTGAEAAIVFATGTMANMGWAAAFGGHDAHIFSDERNHASVIDACRISRAQVAVWRHADAEDLERALASSRSERKIVVTDGVFSMDGDVAPLREIVAVARRHGAEVVVDDAHGFGVLGDYGRGTREWLGVERETPVFMATLSKAAGAAGGFVAGPQEVIALLRHRARTFVYSTAPPPAVAAAARAGVRLLAEAQDRRARLRENVRRLRARLGGSGDHPTPIVPVVLGTPQRALEVARALWERGVFAPAIRPPTVPEGTSRLRISVTALHEPEHIEALADALEEVGAVRGCPR